MNAGMLIDNIGYDSCRAKEILPRQLRTAQILEKSDRDVKESKKSSAVVLPRGCAINRNGKPLLKDFPGKSCCRRDFPKLWSWYLRKAHGASLRWLRTLLFLIEINHESGFNFQLLRLNPPVSGGLSPAEDVFYRRNNNNKMEDPPIAVIPANSARKVRRSVWSGGLPATSGHEEVGRHARITERTLIDFDHPTLDGIHRSGPFPAS